jgi:hypothetical protein
VQDAYPEVLFVTDWVDLDFQTLAGKTFCFSPRPDALIPIAMLALEMWTARPASTTVIMLVARDFGTKGLRQIMRQFDEVEPTKRYHRLLATGEGCVWDTMLMVKGPRRPPKVGSREVNREHARLVRDKKEGAASKQWPEREIAAYYPGPRRVGGRSECKCRAWCFHSPKCEPGTRGTGDSEPIGAAVAYAMGLGTPDQPTGRPAQVTRLEDEKEEEEEEVMYDMLSCLDDLHEREDTRNAELLEELAGLGVRGERSVQVRTYSSGVRGQGMKSSLRGRRLTGRKGARGGPRLKCRTCGSYDVGTDMFACRFRDVGADTARFGRLPACGEVHCHRCLSQGVPQKAHPPREGLEPVELTEFHARLTAGAHVCSKCRWQLCTGKQLDMRDEEDIYVWELITQYLLDIYRHLSPKTTKGYAREVNVLADFAAALPDLDPSDVLGGTSFDKAGTRASTIHGILWLHLKRGSRLKYGTIRKARSVHSKVTETYGEQSYLNQEGSEFKRFTRAFRLRVGTGSKPTLALSVKAWLEMVKEHGVEYGIHVEEGDTRAARDVLCRMVHAELSFLGFLRPGEQVCMKREDVQAMICPPDRAEGLGVEPFVVLPLLGATKTSPTEAAGVVVAWVTASGLRVGEHVTELLQMYKDDGEEEGALLTHGRAKRAWSKAFALHRVLRPALRKLQADGRGIEPEAKLKEYTSNTFRRGGNSHALDRGVTRHQCTSHGRWESKWEGRGGLSMVDLYDATGTDRKLVVTSKMG